MQVKRIVANIAAEDIAAARRFYQDILGLEVLMDHGWIATYGSSQKMSVQVSIASQGGSGTPVPDLSIEVDDLDAACVKERAGGANEQLSRCFDNLHLHFGKRPCQLNRLKTVAVWINIDQLCRVEIHDCHKRRQRWDGIIEVQPLNLNE